MSNRDQFLRQPTVPLRRAPTRPVGDVALAAQLEDALGRAGGLLDGAAGPIAALHEACRRAAAPPPGVPDDPPARALAPAEEAAAGAIAAALPHDAALRRKVQVAVFRLHEARQAVAAGEAARAGTGLTLAVVERLRQALYYVSAYHLEFKADPLVQPLFPGPRTHAPSPLTEIQRLKRKLAQEAAMEAAKELAEGLEAPLKAAALVVAMADGTRGMGFKDLLDAGARQAKLIALHLAKDPGAVARLREAIRAHAALKAAIAKVRSFEEAPKVEAAAFPLTGFEHACRQHPALAMLFPPP